MSRAPLAAASRRYGGPCWTDGDDMKRMASVLTVDFAVWYVPRTGLLVKCHRPSSGRPSPPYAASCVVGGHGRIRRSGTPAHIDCIDISLLAGGAANTVSAGGKFCSRNG